MKKALLLLLLLSACDTSVKEFQLKTPQFKATYNKSYKELSECFKSAVEYDEGIAMWDYTIMYMPKSIIIAQTLYQGTINNTLEFIPLSSNTTELVHRGRENNMIYFNPYLDQCI
jgi:hypothetical protein